MLKRFEAESVQKDLGTKHTWQPDICRNDQVKSTANAIW